MSPEERLLHRLASEIEAELGRLERLRGEAADTPREEATWSLRARGSILHDFYGGAERVFCRIAEEVDGGLPRGEHWHRQLLRAMTFPVEGVRPGVISTSLATRMEDFLGFRHVFRNMYGYVLDTERLARLEAELSPTLDELTEQVRVFLNWTQGGGDAPRKGTTDQPA